MSKCFVVSMLLTVLAMPGFSQAKEKEKAVTTLEEVVVTAGRVEEKKKEITSNVTIINEEEIKNSSARDLGDLLIENGIGHTHKYPDNLTPIGIRGFRSETHGIDLEGYVIILLDGHRVATGNASKIMTKNIERVEIIRGPASVQYGSAAMGGVVNVITKQGKEKPKVFLEGILGTFGHKEGSVGFSGKHNRFDFSGSFTKGSRDDYDTASGERYYNTGYDSKEDVSLNVGFEFLPGNRIGVIYTDFDADQVGNPDALYQNDLDDYWDISNRSIDVVYDGATPDGLFSWKARYYDGEDENTWFDPIASNPDFWDDGLPRKVTVDHKGAQAQASYNQEYLLLTAGFDWMNYETKDDTLSPKNTEYDNPAYFLLAKTRLLDRRLIISGGLRYDDFEVDMKGEGRKESDDYLCPRAGVAYLLTDWLKLRANYGKAFRMPSANQLAADYIAYGTHYVGNPNLEPEKSETYEGGVDFYYASLNSSFTYFSTDFKDKIESDAGWPDSTWYNVGKAKVEGWEGEFSYDIGGFFGSDFEIKPYASFVYLTEYKDKETGKDLKYTSDLHVSYGITVSDLKGFSANLNLAYTGEQMIDDWRSGWSAPVVEKKSFTVANFTISKKIIDFGKFGGMTLRGEIQNLFDKDYEYVQGYPMPGRSFFLGLRYNF
ncbi:MAG: TonB-dependent receptor [Deltaproteobacteria bacterium]|nr:TonB-dependent receptor [Deltaproteobacteria bacterium]